MNGKRGARGGAPAIIVRYERGPVGREPPPHAWRPGTGQPRHRLLRRLLLLAAMIAGAWWAWGQVSSFGGAVPALIPTATSRPSAVPAAGSRRSAPRSIAATAVMPAAPHAGTTVESLRALPTRLAAVIPGPKATAARRPPSASAMPEAPLPSTVLIHNDYQVYETWNNCGPASLSMALSYFGIDLSQATLADTLRPYQNAQGINDDKDVTLDELATEARTLGLLAYHRPAGSVASLKRFLAAGLPVIVETVLTKDDDIGHFRVVKGYDDPAGAIVQDDSMQGHNVRFLYADFAAMWKKYNYEYLVLVPRPKQHTAETILGRDLQARVAWARTARQDRAALVLDPADVDSRFNLSIALFYLGDYSGCVHAYEQVRAQLPFRTLWYQIEPIEAYFRLAQYQTVFTLTDAIFQHGNPAFSQLYLLRGAIDVKLGRPAAAREEYGKAVLYNVHLKAAREALRSLPA